MVANTRFRSSKMAPAGTGQGTTTVTASMKTTDESGPPPPKNAAISILEANATNDRKLHDLLRDGSTVAILKDGFIQMGVTLPRGKKKKEALITELISAYKAKNEEEKPPREEDPKSTAAVNFVTSQIPSVGSTADDINNVVDLVKRESPNKMKALLPSNKSSSSAIDDKENQPHLFMANNITTTSVVFASIPKPSVPFDATINESHIVTKKCSTMNTATVDAKIASTSTDVIANMNPHFSTTTVGRIGVNEDRVSNMLRELNIMVTKQEAIIDEYKKENDGLVGELNKYKKKNDLLEEDNGCLKKALDEKEQDDKWKFAVQYNVLTEELNITKHENSRLKIENGCLKNEVIEKELDVLAADDDKRKFRAKCNVLTGKLDDVTLDFKFVTAELQRAEAEKEQKEQEVHHLNVVMKDLKEENSELTRNLDITTSYLHVVTQNLEDKAGEYFSLERKGDTAISIPPHNTATIPTATVIKNIVNPCITLDQNIHSHVIQFLRKQTEELEIALKQSLTENDSLKEEVSNLKEENGFLKKDIIDVREDNDWMALEMDTLREDNEEKEIEIFAMQEEIQQLNENNSKLTDEFNDVTEDLQLVTEKLELVTEDLERVNEENYFLEEKNENFVSVNEDLEWKFSHLSGIVVNKVLECLLSKQSAPLTDIDVDSLSIDSETTRLGV